MGFRLQQEDRYNYWIMNSFTRMESYRLPILLLWVFMVFAACEKGADSEQKATSLLATNADPYLVVLGTAQDAGYPQASCRKACCQAVWQGNAQAEQVSCLGIVDPQSQQLWLLDATPDFREQWQQLQGQLPEAPSQPAGVLLTHAHIGHYTGLMHLGREVMGAKEVPVYALPRLDTFLHTNGPWSQLVALNNVAIKTLSQDSVFALNERLTATAMSVPHRDEFSETAGFRIEGPNRSFLFIPDIDKWEQWDRPLAEELQKVDYAFLDATFFADGELPNRDMSKIPHPFVTETMDLLQSLPSAERAKVHFIHINHTNPLMDPKSAATRQVEERGFAVARTGQRMGL